MRNKLLGCIFSFLIVGNVFSQVPAWKQLSGKFWPDDSAIWSVLHEVYNPPFYEYGPIYYKMLGDTSQNGISYKCVYKGSEKSYSVNNTDTFYCFLRLSDSVGSKVYIKYPYTRFDDTSEFVLYDFTMKKGDTTHMRFTDQYSSRKFVELNAWYRSDFKSDLISNINSNLPLDSCKATLDGLPINLKDSVVYYSSYIDAISLPNPIRYNGEFLYSWVGIYPHHPFYAECDSIGWGRLKNLSKTFLFTCFDYKGQSILKDCVKRSCDSKGNTGIEDLKRSIYFNISLYPNPCRQGEPVTIDMEESIGNNTLELYTIDGQLIKQINSANNLVYINTMDLSSGIYLLKTTNQSISSFKITKLIIL